MTRKQYTGETLILQNFSYQELACANFEHAILMACDFRGAFLNQATFANATLITCDFRGADLRQANLRVRSARTCSFGNANLAGVLWEEETDPIGDVRCVYNARSPYLRCAIHPMGPCEGCRWFATAETESGTENRGGAQP